MSKKEKVVKEPKVYTRKQIILAVTKFVVVLGIGIAIGVSATAKVNAVVDHQVSVQVKELKQGQ